MNESRWKKCYKSESSGVRRKLEGSQAFQMFALYHLQQLLIVSWVNRCGTKQGCKKSMLLCNISSTDKPNWGLAILKQISKSKGICVSQSHRQKPLGGKKELNTDETISCILASVSQVCPRSFLCPNRAVSQTVRHENRHYFPWLQLAVGLCWTGRQRKEILLLCPWAMLNCFSKTDTGLWSCFMAAIESGGDDYCWLGNSKDGEESEVGQKLIAF